MSFMTIRFIQQFSSITLDPDVFLPEVLPPVDWKNREGRMTVEKVQPKMHLTMYVQVWLMLFSGCMHAYVQLLVHSSREGCG
jgi:hypothetical protein